MNSAAFVGGAAVFRPCRQTCPPGTVLLGTDSQRYSSDKDPFTTSPHDYELKGVCISSDVLYERVKVRQYELTVNRSE